MAAAKKVVQRQLWVIGIVWLLALISLTASIALDWIYTTSPVAYDTESYVNTGSAFSEGLAILAVVLIVAALALTCIYLLAWVGHLAANSDSVVSDLRKLLAGQTQSEALLTHIGENLLLSDKVKSIAFREKDQMVLQGAIEEDMRMERWDSAAILIKELADRFGDQHQAQQLMQEMKRLQNSTLQEKIDAAVKHIESLWMIHHYADAQREVESLLRLYPQVERVQALKGETEKRRDEHKKALLARWEEAVRKNDIDQGVELLKLLDEYLTPTEAAALEESARGVFKAKLLNMGVQFKLFVTEKKWHQALNLGRKIIEEYPNSRMAQEVRDKLDILEQRARAHES